MLLCCLPISDQLIIPCKLLHIPVSPDENSLSFRSCPVFRIRPSQLLPMDFYYTVVLSYNDRFPGRLPFDAAAVPCKVRLQDVLSLTGSAFAGRLPQMVSVPAAVVFIKHRYRITALAGDRFLLLSDPPLLIFIVKQKVILTSDNIYEVASKKKGVDEKNFNKF